MVHSLACCIDSDIIPSLRAKSVGHFFASVALSTYSEATRTLMLPGGWNSRYLLRHHSPHVSISKGYRTQMWTIMWTQKKRDQQLLDFEGETVLLIGRSHAFHSHQPPGVLFGSYSCEMKPRSPLSLLFPPLYLYCCNAHREKKSSKISIAAVYWPHLLPFTPITLAGTSVGVIPPLFGYTPGPSLLLTFS